MRNPPPDLSFADALGRLAAGQVIARRWWRGAGGPPELLPPAYIVRRPGDHLIAFWPGPPPRAREWRPTGEDVFATDWRVLSASEMIALEGRA